MKDVAERNKVSSDHQGLPAPSSWQRPRRYSSITQRFRNPLLPLFSFTKELATWSLYFLRGPIQSKHYWNVTYVARSLLFFIEDFWVGFGFLRYYTCILVGLLVLVPYKLRGQNFLLRIFNKVRVLKGISNIKVKVWLNLTKSATHEGRTHRSCNHRSIDRSRKKSRSSIDRGTVLKFDAKKMKSKFPIFLSSPYSWL